MASVERDAQAVLAFSDCLLDEFGRGHAKAIVRNGECMSLAQLGGKMLKEFLSNGIRQGSLRFVVHAENLLRGGVSPASEKT